MKPVTRAEIEGLADEMGCAVGAVGREVDQLAGLYIEQGTQISQLEATLLDLLAVLEARLNALEAKAIREPTKPALVV